MGEAKRKKNRPCICGSGLLAGTCCYGTGGWRKEAGDIRLDDTGFSGSHANCYLSSTNTCSTKISSEHVISGSVLNVLTEKSIEISGVPWLKPGEKKRIGIASLVANCLCTAHNSSLSALDTAAGKFFEAIQKCGTTETRPGLEFIVNGHDIERWFLKMLAGMSVSNYLGANGVPLTGFHSSIDIVGLLQDPRKWMPPLGLYFTQSLGHRFRREDSFALAPLSLDESGEIAECWAMSKVFISLYWPSTVRYKGAALNGRLIVRGGSILLSATQDIRSSCPGTMVSCTGKSR